MEDLSLCKTWTLAPCLTLQCEGWDKDKHGVLNTQSRKKEEQGTLFSVFASSAGLRAVGCAQEASPSMAQRAWSGPRGLVTPSQKSSPPSPASVNCLQNILFPCTASESIGTPGISGFLQISVPPGGQLRALAIQVLKTAQGSFFTLSLHCSLITDPLWDLGTS